MTLMPVSKISVAGLRSPSGGAGRWIGARGHVGRQRRAVVADVAHDIEETSEKGIADRHGDRMAGRAHRHAAPQPVRCLQRHATHGVLVEMRLDLDHEGLRAVPFNDQRLFQSRKLGAGKGNVDDGSAYREHLPCRSPGHRYRHACPPFPFKSASYCSAVTGRAPPPTS